VQFCLPCKVDVAFVARNCFGALDWLRESPSDAKWISAGLGWAIEILALDLISVYGDWGLLRVIALRDTGSELVIGCFLSATPHATLNDQLVVSLSDRHISSVLSPHDFLANYVDSKILYWVLRAIPSIEESLLEQSFLLILFLFHLCSDLCSDHLLEGLSSETDPWDFRSWVTASAPVARGWLHVCFDFSTVNTSVSVIENFSCLNWIIEVQVTLGNMLSHDRSRKSEFGNRQISRGMRRSLCISVWLK
jgi:hypothetical protein